MSKVQWVKYHDMGGPRYKGTVKFNPSKPWDKWDRIVGTVARCEGDIDSVVMYDNTITWGFGGWTFNSGRLQKLLESFKSIPNYDFESEHEDTLFDSVCTMGYGIQIFEPFGFRISGGKFVDITGTKPVEEDTYVLDPSRPKHRKRIIEICMGRTIHKTFKDQKDHAMKLAQVFADLGKQFGVAEAQVDFAKAEFKRALGYRRPPLGNIETIGNLLEGTWDTPTPGLFFNLFQNNPKAAFKLFKNVYINSLAGSSDYNWDFFDLAWRKLNVSKFGNWSYAKPGNKSPRVVRIKKAIKEFYDIDLKIYK